MCALTTERAERTSVTREDIRQFRDAISGALGLADSDVLPQPDPAWRQSWSALAELGVTGLCVPEERGGAGFEVEVAVAASMELGGSLHGSPYAGTVAATHAMAATAMTDEVAHDVLGGVLSSERICAFARLDVPGDVAQTVDGALDADALVIELPDGDHLLFADPASWSVTGHRHDFDVSRTCTDLRVDLAAGRPLGTSPATGLLFGLLVAADAVGGAQRAMARTVDYATDRIAFGKPIGGFQAVQHRLADHAVRIRGMELLLAEAASAIGDADRSARRRTLLAEASTSSAVPTLLHDLVQLTGGIGFTWEYGLHFYGRRAHQDAALGSNPRRARQLLAVEESWSDG